MTGGMLVRCALGWVTKVPTGADPLGATLATLSTKTHYLLVEARPKGA